MTTTTSHNDASYGLDRPQRRLTTETKGATEPTVTLSAPPPPCALSSISPSATWSPVASPSPAAASATTPDPATPLERLGARPRLRTVRRLSVRRSSSLSPPHTPSPMPASMAHSKQRLCTAHRLHTALACWSCRTAGALVPIGKNSSGFSPRQAAYSCQLISGPRVLAPPLVSSFVVDGLGLRLSAAEGSPPPGLPRHWGPVRGHEAIRPRHTARRVGRRSPLHGRGDPG